jgi:rod shape-determining protein MreB
MGRDLAIDLGTANTLVHRAGDGVVFDEPSVVAVNVVTGRVETVGDEAWQMVGGPGTDVTALRPLRQGVVTEFEITRRMLRAILRRVGVQRLSRPRVLVCVPSGSTPVERRAVEEAVTSAGARRAILVEESLAAAIGAGLPVHEPIGNLIVDIGGGSSDMAVVSMGGVVSARSARIGGFDLDAAIQEHVRAEYGVAIGEKAAEAVKVAIGSAYPVPTNRACEVRGRELATGAAREVVLSEEEVRQAMSTPVRAIVETARVCLAEAPPELTHDVLETGIFLTGGGGLLRGLDVLLSRECEVPVHLTEQPLRTVITGAGRMLEHLDDFRRSFQLVRRR